MPTTYLLTHFNRIKCEWKQWLSIYSWTGSILGSAYSRAGTASLYCPHV